MNGCHNRAPFANYILMQDGYVNGHYTNKDNGKRRMRPVPNPMTKDCQYTISDLGQKDTGCAGCKHRKETP